LFKDRYSTSKLLETEYNYIGLLFKEINLILLLFPNLMRERERERDRKRERESFPKARIISEGKGPILYISLRRDLELLKPS
jgi:hypothetical protein